MHMHIHGERHTHSRKKRVAYGRSLHVCVYTCVHVHLRVRNDRERRAREAKRDRTGMVAGTAAHVVRLLSRKGCAGKAEKPGHLERKGQTASNNKNRADTALHPRGHKQGKRESTGRRGSREEAGARVHRNTTRAGWCAQGLGGKGSNTKTSEHSREKMKRMKDRQRYIDRDTPITKKQSTHTKGWGQGEEGKE